MRPARERHQPLDDLWPRAVGISTFGVVIPQVFGLYGDVPVLTGRWWCGQVLFLALSFCVWQGNRALLFTTATRFDWLERPWGRVGRLLIGIVLFTGPLTVAALQAWFVFGRGRGATLAELEGVVLTNVICVVFVTHVYETVLLLKARQADLVRVAEAERARAESELLALRRQVDPHFLFNSLNTLQALLESDPQRARRFNEALAAMLRYLLETSERQLVSLRVELVFVEKYAELLSIRFGEAFRLTLEQHEVDLDHHTVPPTAVQLLVENAVAHNRLSTREPLDVTVRVTSNGVIVRNVMRRRPDSSGAGIGLKNLAERLRLASRGNLDVSTGDGCFTVTLPLGGAP